MGSIPADADDADDVAIASKILGLLAERALESSICPSEVARAFSDDPAAWRALMPRVRAVAKALADQGRLRVTRRGVEVDATAGGGPIRLSRHPDDRTP